VKLATSSATFASAIASGRWTQLEWLDACANELEADAVVFDVRQFPRTDDDYAAHLKKLAADLGLTVAALAADDVFAPDGGARFALALALGAPLLVARAPATRGDASAWGAFADVAKARAGDAKRANVTLAVRNAPATLCANGADLKRLAKDVDSAWLRFAIDPTTLDASDDARALLGKTVLAAHAIDDCASFAHDDDPEARALVASLARFRGCVLIETAREPEPRDAFHAALERFARLRTRALASNA
jgi:sugar phosphate isomerase/epimerase